MNLFNTGYGVVWGNCLPTDAEFDTFRINGPCEIEDFGGVFFSQHSVTDYSRRIGPSKIWPSGHVEYTDKRSDRHRTTGPAVITENGRKEYWVHGVCMSDEEFFLKYGAL